MNIPMFSAVVFAYGHVGVRIYILFTTTLAEPVEWRLSADNQLEAEVFRLGGMPLLMGILHGANVLSLPVIGRLGLGSTTASPPGSAIV